jgi:hypothetical protein
LLPGPADPQAERYFAEEDQQAIACLRGWPIHGPLAVGAGGVSFILTSPEIPARSTADSWPPGIAELAACSWQDRTGHYAAKTAKNRAKNWDARQVRALVDEPGTPILHTSGESFHFRACALSRSPASDGSGFWCEGPRSRTRS